MDIDYTKWITVNTFFEVGGSPLSIDSTIPTEMTSTATEWIQTNSTAENKE